jgi:DHA1 family bicyclomycin/chloramphenicol resistance-like MFS transporter
VNSPSNHLKRGFVVTLGLLTGISAFTIDVSLPAIPAMADALATTLSRGQQIVGVFMAGMAVGQVPAGLISDRIGRLPVMYVGMVLFVAGAIAAAATNDIEAMLIARFIQGLGSSTAIVLSRAIVRDVSSGKEAARLMSVLMMIFTAAPVIAPTIGALIITAWGWRAPFVLVAGLGLMVLISIRVYLTETHSPGPNVHPLRQFKSSVQEFFSHRQSIFGLLMVILPPAGFMSIIPISSALVVETYGFSLQAFGFIFAAAGLSILLGSFINRLLVVRFDMMQLMAFGIVLLGTAGAQFFAMIWLDQAPLWWLWGNVCLFFVSVTILMPNAVVVALDPLPKIAGVASSIVGTLQGFTGAAGAIGGAIIYDGSVRNSVTIVTLVSMVALTMFLLRPLIAPGPFVHHEDELARD